jgi:class I fructose-bisphosphate aldolase
MGLGTDIRLKRIFSHPSGRLFGVAVDHFIGYGDVRKGGLADLAGALKATMQVAPDSLTINAGAAKSLWRPFAGQAALIVQGGTFTADDRVRELTAEPEDAVRLGADALAVSIGVRGLKEGAYIKWLTDSVRKAAAVEIPVIAHIYPRNYEGEPTIEFTPEQIAWAVRVGLETGVDVIKVGYPGEIAAFRDIIAMTPVPIVMAGGPKASTLVEALQYTQDALSAGALGAVVGRNLWGAENICEAALAYRAVIHDGVEPAEAVRLAQETAI